MQASKLEIEATYAIRREGKLVRFRVDAVNTRRIAKGPKGYKSTVDGRIIEGEAPWENLTVEPQEILGPYQEHVELVARETAEKEERQRVRVIQEAKAERAAKLLREVLDIPEPEDCDEPRYRRKRRDNDVRQMFGTQVQVEGVEAVDRLLAFLENLKTKEDQ